VWCGSARFGLVWFGLVRLGSHLLYGVSICTRDMPRALGWRFLRVLWVYHFSGLQICFFFGYLGCGRFDNGMAGWIGRTKGWMDER
jgi:hypothetical protein